MNNNTVLIVMPMYNSEATVARAIESILNQTYKNIVLCIIDDASTDESYKIAKSYTKDHRVMVHRNNSNMGAYYSRNMGLFLNRTRPWGFFTTHDADDISYPHRISAMVSLTKRSGVVAVQDTFTRKRLSTGKAINTSLTMAHALFKRIVFKNIGYFEVVRFGADWEYWNRLNIYNKTLGYTTASIKQVVGESYVHSNNLTIIIPLGSKERKKYIAQTRENHRNIMVNKNFYISFSPKDYV